MALSIDSSKIFYNGLFDVASRRRIFTSGRRIYGVKYMKQIEELYQSVLEDGGFIKKQQEDVADHFICYELRPDKGQGQYLLYFYQDMFEIAFRDFLFYDDYFLECPEIDFLSIEYYFSVSGEEFFPYYQLSPNSLRVHIGERHKLFQAIYHKNIPIRSVGISIMPEFYEQYLREVFL
jgi:hypothetical protein